MQCEKGILILKHLGLWDIKARLLPKAKAPSLAIYPGGEEIGRYSLPICKADLVLDSIRLDADAETTTGEPKDLRKIGGHPSKWVTPKYPGRKERYDAD